MIIIPLYDLCAQNTELAALLTDDIGLKVGEFDANNVDRAPYVCWQTITANPEQYLDDASDMDDVYVQIDIYANEKDQTRLLARLIRSVIEDQCYIETYTGIERDPETALYRIRIDSRWHEEP